MKRLSCCLLLALAATMLAGCGSSGPETCTVSGTVTWNGKPLPDGTILFAPEDGKGVPDAGDITEGKYRLQVKPGKKKVEIHAERVTGKPDPVMGMAPRQAYIPARYNTETELKAEVAPGGKNEFPFKLEGPEPE